MTEPTFLELVRLLAAETLKQCHDECSMRLHIHDAAMTVTMLVDNPHLAYALARHAEKYND
jgi:hypothetical protein